MPDNNRLYVFLMLMIILASAVFIVHVRNNSGGIKAGPHTITGQPNNGSMPPPPANDKDSNGCYTPETVRKHYGETDCVDFQVGYTHETSAGTKFIDEKVDYSSGFVAYIPWDSAANDIDLSAIDGKNIRVSGYIQQYNGYPEIVVNNRSQVGVY